MPLLPSTPRASAQIWRGPAGVVELCQPGNYVAELAALPESADLQAVQLHRGELGEHLDQAVLDDSESWQVAGRTAGVAWRR